MPYKITWEEHGAYRKYYGYVTGKEIIQAVRDVEGNPRFNLLCYVINDLLEVVEHDVSPRNIEVLAAVDRAAALSNPNLKIAVVSTMPEVQDMYSPYTEIKADIPFFCEQFTRIDEARKWVEEVM